jgi:hypothetical protein
MSPNETLWRGNLVLDQSDAVNERYFYILSSKNPQPVLNLPWIFNLSLFPTRKCCEMKVTMSSHEESKNNQSTFNWGPGKKYPFLHFYLLYSSQDIPAVQLKRYPRCALKRTGAEGEELNLNQHLKVRL